MTFDTLCEQGRLLPVMRLHSFLSFEQGRLAKFIECIAAIKPEVGKGIYWTMVSTDIISSKRPKLRPGARAPRQTSSHAAQAKSPE